MYCRIKKSIFPDIRIQIYMAVRNGSVSLNRRKERRMTIDEAIKHCEEVAEENDKIANTFEYSLKTKSDCKECASEHRQLAEWLRELKKLRNFTHFIARNVMEDDFEENGRFYTEVFCRRLNKLGVIRSENNKWIYDEEVNADD
jgi:hypothetical protein